MLPENNIENSINKILPEEMLEKIFSYLPPKTLKLVVLVCNRWREIGESPRLWSWLRLSVTQENISFFPDLLSRTRFKSVKTLSINAVSEDLLDTVSRHPGLKEVRMIDMVVGDFYSMDPDLLAKAVSKLQTVAFSSAKLTLSQSEAILVSLSKGSPIKNLFMGWQKMSTIAPSLLKASIVYLETFDVQHSCLGTEQLEAIFEAIVDGTSLKKLSLSNNFDLSLVNSQLMAEAIIKLENICLYSTKLKTDQANAIVSAIIGGSQIRRLSFGGNRLLHVDPYWLAKAVNSLIDVDLRQSYLTCQQVTAILTEILGQSSLKRLYIDKTDVDSQLLKLARTKCKIGLFIGPGSLN